MPRQICVGFVSGGKDQRRMTNKTPLQIDTIKQTKAIAAVNNTANRDIKPIRKRTGQLLIGHD